MKKIISKSLLLSIIILCVLSMFFIENKKEHQKEEDRKLNQQIEQTLQELSLEEKIAQMIMISNRTPTMTEELKQELEKYQPGGFIFFKDNFSNLDSSLQLIKEIKQTVKIPLFLSIDQEGGRVQRITSEVDASITNIPPMQEIGNKNSKQLAFQVGTLLAEELRVFHINMNFAPVLDINSNPQNTVISNRSFGNNAEIVSNMGISLAKGMQEIGVIPVYKHFPGHGSTITDSHYDLPIINKTKEELQNLEWIPFQNAIQNGADMIMVGHLAVPSITGSNIPASLSYEIITEILKKEMGFSGLIITDALNMKALTKNYSESEIYERAINAGVDILLMPESIESAITKIKESYENQKISIEQINNSVRKILKLKYTKLSKDYLDKSYLGNESHLQIMREFQK